jgi:hypothetical protein
MEIEFKELMFTLPAPEMKILRSAAANYDQNEEGSMVICKLYFPQMPTDKARRFMRWLASNPPLAMQPRDQA